MDPVLGKPEAPVTIIAFSDYRCPYCRDLSRTLDQLLERHPDDVRVVYRNYPLHDDSDTLAQATLCAADQGKFAAYHQNVFARNAGAKDVAPIAVDVGLDLPSFDACIKDQHHRSRIDGDMKEGQRLGFSGRRPFFGAGQRRRGAQQLQCCVYARWRQLDHCARPHDADGLPGATDERRAAVYGCTVRDGRLPNRRPRARSARR